MSELKIFYCKGCRSTWNDAPLLNTFQTAGRAHKVAEGAGPEWFRVGRWKERGQELYGVGSQWQQCVLASCSQFSSSPSLLFSISWHLQNSWFGSKETHRWSGSQLGVFYLALAGHLITPPVTSRCWCSCMLWRSGGYNLSQALKAGYLRLGSLARGNYIVGNRFFHI